MNAQDNVFKIDNGETASRNAINDFGVRHYTIGPIALLVALMVGAAQWAQSPSDAAAVETAQQESRVNNTAAPSEYFPAAYVNQATEREDHIEAF
jgi:hypothetical protein